MAKLNLISEAVPALATTIEVDPAAIEVGQRGYWFSSTKSLELSGMAGHMGGAYILYMIMKASSINGLVEKNQNDLASLLGDTDRRTVSTHTRTLKAMGLIRNRGRNKNNETVYQVMERVVVRDGDKPVFDIVFPYGESVIDPSKKIRVMIDKAVANGVLPEPFGDFEFRPHLSAPGKKEKKKSAEPKPKKSGKGKGNVEPLPDGVTTETESWAFH